MCWSSSTGFARAMRISWNIRQRRSWKSWVFQCGPLKTLAMSLSVCDDAVLVVGDHEGAERGAGDDHHLEGQRVQDDADLAAGEHVAAEDHHKDDADADDADHASIPCSAERAASRPYPPDPV